MLTAAKETAQALYMAENLYKYIIARCKEHIDIVEQGEFGADMKVELVNDGPFTVILDSNEL